MTNQQTILKLQNIIREKLTPTIRNKVILTDLPYHGNIGDILIWEGERRFLKEIGISPISQTSLSTFMFPELDRDVTICLNGGGNFGDLYRIAQDFRIEVIKTYPENRIVIFPQSVWYEDESLIETDAKKFSMHHNLYICARDSASYEFLCKHFYKNRILLVPDMAFFIGDLSTISLPDKDKKNAIFIRRKDKEAIDRNFPVKEQHDIRDWPMFENKEVVLHFFQKLCLTLGRKDNMALKKIGNEIMDKGMRWYFKENLIKHGISLLSPYRTIYTTRLHAMILGVLLDKEIIAFDNSTGKVSGFVNTWLQDDSKVTVL